MGLKGTRIGRPAGVDHPGQSRYNEDVGRKLDLLAQTLLVDAVLTDEVDLTTTGQAVPHRLGSTPRGWLPATLSADARIWQTADADDKYLYLVASSAVTCRLVVF